MKTYDISKDIKRIRMFFELSQSEFANLIGLSRSNILRIENNQIFPHPSTLESVYGYAYDNGLNLNLEKSRFFEEEKGDSIVLYHGAKFEIEGEVDNKHSIKPNDFGDGFYLGETLKQSAEWVCGVPNSSVYCFYLKLNNNLKIKKLTVGREWLYSILYYRDGFSGKNVPIEVQSIVDEIESSDIIISPIADNKMYEIINKFINKEITDEACIHALSLTDLGNQYVLKTMKAIKCLKFIDRLYLNRHEKQDYTRIKIDSVFETENKVKMSLLEYRRKGNYIDELFK